MIGRLRYFLVLATISAGLIPAAAAQAQYAAVPNDPPPPYPYVGPSDSPKAAPTAAKPQATPRPASSRHRRHVRCTHDCVSAPKTVHSRKSKESGPIGELRRRPATKRTVVNTRRILHERPIVIETRRVVADPPRAIEGRHSIGGAPDSTRGKRLAKVDDLAPRANRERVRTKGRVIHADAEVTILGPDRMIIRLSRKKSRRIETSARAD